MHHCSQKLYMSLSLHVALAIYFLHYFFTAELGYFVELFYFPSDLFRRVLITVALVSRHCLKQHTKTICKSFREQFVDSQASKRRETIHRIQWYLIREDT